MVHLRVVPIVEGHGEVESIRLLIGRVVHELIGTGTVDVLQPLRVPRANLAMKRGFTNAVKFAGKKLEFAPAVDARDLILVLLDADDDCPAELAPRLVGWAREAAGDRDVSCVLANKEFETWFVAAADSLSGLLDVPQGDAYPESPETARQGKAWVERYSSGFRYSPTIDQARMVARMDLSACRSRSESFDKFCRELESRLDSDFGGPPAPK